MCDDLFETDVKDLWGLCTPNSIIVVYSRGISILGEVRNVEI